MEQQALKFLSVTICRHKSLTSPIRHRSTIVKSSITTNNPLNKAHCRNKLRRLRWQSWPLHDKNHLHTRLTLHVTTVTAAPPPQSSAFHSQPRQTSKQHMHRATLTVSPTADILWLRKNPNIVKKEFRLDESILSGQLSFVYPKIVRLGMT